MTERELIHAYGVKRLCPCREEVRIEHDAEPCLPSVEVVSPIGDICTPVIVRSHDPRPVLTRLPAIAGTRA